MSGGRLGPPGVGRPEDLDRPVPLAFLDDDLDFYDHDHQR